MTRRATIQAAASAERGEDRMTPSHRRLAVIAAALVALTATSCAPADPLPYTGVNIAGGEFYEPRPDTRPKHGTNFVYPSEQEIAYFASRGMNVFRYPFRWETLQAKLKIDFRQA